MFMEVSEAFPDEKIWKKFDAYSNFPRTHLENYHNYDNHTYRGNRGRIHLIKVNSIVLRRINYL